MMFKKKVKKQKQMPLLPLILLHLTPIPHPLPLATLSLFSVSKPVFVLFCLFIRSGVLLFFQIPHIS